MNAKFAVDALGRPLMLGEELRSVSFMVPVCKVSALDNKVKLEGMGRAGYLRKLIEKDLAVV